MILIGFMGSGKTTAATHVAESLNIKHIDIDEAIIEKFKKPISQIFSEEGEVGFRKKEQEVLESLLYEDAVISTGGGVVTHPASLKLLQSQNKHKVFYLSAPFHVLYERIKEDTSRPLASQQEDKVYALYERRLPLYEKASHHCINSDQPIFQIAEQITNLNDD